MAAAETCRLAEVLIVDHTIASIRGLVRGKVGSPLVIAICRRADIGLALQQACTLKIEKPQEELP